MKNKQKKTDIQSGSGDSCEPGVTRVKVLRGRMAKALAGGKLSPGAECSEQGDGAENHSDFSSAGLSPPYSPCPKQKEAKIEHLSTFSLW